LAARSDRELALLAQEHGIELPQHLSHLPMLPVPRSAEEDARLQAEMAAAEAEIHGEVEPMKERPPRKVRLGLQQVWSVGTSSFGQRRASQSNSARSATHATTSPATSPAASAAPVEPPPSRAQQSSLPQALPPPMDEGYLTGAAVKEAAPSVRRKKKSKPKSGRSNKDPVVV
jgi:hypothetical protein